MCSRRTSCVEAWRTWPGRGTRRRWWGCTTSVRKRSNFLAATVGWPLADLGSFVERGSWSWVRYMLATMPGGRDELRRVVDPELADLVDELATPRPSRRVDGPAGVDDRGSRRRGFGACGFGSMTPTDTVAGFCILSKPGAGMSHLGRAAATADLAHLERMRVVEAPDRRPAAILMADLEASSPSGASPFDRAVLRVRSPSRTRRGPMHHRCGRHCRPPRRRWRRRVLPRRHDGIRVRRGESVHHRGTSPARRAPRHCRAQRAFRGRVSLRFGLHWGATLYMGRILTAGRSEVTALGDEVNEAARIEASATGGRTLASKSLIERLNRTMPTRSDSTPATRNTHHSPTSPPRPTRHAETPPSSPSATSDSEHENTE